MFARTILISLVAFPWLVETAASQLEQGRSENLEINGVQLRLGMDQNSVFQMLREKKFGVSKVEQFSSSTRSAWALCESPDDNICGLGQVTFENGHLALILKRWIETKNAADTVAAFYGAAKDLEKRGLKRCELLPEENLLPGQEVKMVKLICSEHLWLHVSVVHTADTPFAVVDDEVLSDDPYFR